MSFKNRKIIRLGTPGAIRSEAGRLYKAWVAGDLGLDELKGGIYALDRICNMHKGIEAEHLLLEIKEEFEGQQRARQGNGHGRARAY
jgi:hypothetical protein